MKDSASPQDRGAAAERYAARYLRHQGLRIIAANYRTRRGEIDLIARDGEYLVFVEVRHRRRNHFGSPAETVDFRKQQRLLAAARHYLQSQGLADRCACRFDVICLENANPNATEFRVEWLRDAFRADG